MKYSKLTAALFIILMVFSCAKKDETKTYRQFDQNGIRITSNTSTPADTSFSYQLKETGFIDMENETDSNKFISRIGSMDIDKDGNLYIMDGEKSVIHKYNRKCNFVKRFGRKGKGPGEFFLPGFINIRKDTIYISNWTSLDIIKYDTDGNYLSYKKLDDFNKFPSYPKKFGNKYISQSTSSRMDEDKGMMMFKNITLYDPDFNFVKDLYRIEYPANSEEENDPGEKGFEGAFNDSLIFVSENSKDKYVINVFNFNGKKIKEIRKNYKRTEAGPNLQERYEEMNRKWNTKYKVRFVNSIMHMVTDKNGRLLVNVYEDENLSGLTFDVYEDDIYVNRITLNLEEGYEPSFIEEKLVAVNRDNNNIKVYDY